MPNDLDFAVVVGISRYPEFGEEPGSDNDLLGPEKDALAIVSWLRAPDGGDIPDKNIKKVVSSDYPPWNKGQIARPSFTDVDETLAWLAEMAEANIQNGLPHKVGRRLYIYMSGHGYSPQSSRGCLFTAEAKGFNARNIDATEWLERLRDGGYFDEFVLWMDCCMERISMIQPGAPALRPMAVPGAAGPTLVALAARRPLRAVETQIEAEVRGVFTWCLLQGLKGAAVDSYGLVTARSLSNWLRNAQKAWIPEVTRDDDKVSLEPEILREDPGLVLLRDRQPTSYPVDITLPEAARHTAVEIWSGMPPDVWECFQASELTTRLSLRPGLYVAVVPALGLRQGFEVLQPMRLTLESQGPPVLKSKPGTLFAMDILPNEPGVEIFIVGPEFALINRSVERLQSRLPFGIYKVKTRADRVIRETILLLDRPHQGEHKPNQEPPFAAPIPGTATSHEYHVAAVTRAAAESGFEAMPGAGAPNFQLMQRSIGCSAAEADPRHLLDRAGQNLDLSLRLSPADLANPVPADWDPFSIEHARAQVADNYLRRQLDGLTIEQCVYIPDGWRLEVFELRLRSLRDARIATRSAGSEMLKISMYLRRIGQPPQFPGGLERAYEQALQALADERRVLGPLMASMLFGKFEQPMAGIVGAHLMVIELEKGHRRLLDGFDQIVLNLRNLVGSDHPDVEALSLMCTDKRLRRSQPFTAPPMLWRSWKLMVDASRDAAELVPRSIWERVEAQVVLRPWLAWAVDENIRRESRNSIQSALMPGPTKTSPSAEMATSPEARAAPSDPVGEGPAGNDEWRLMQRFGMPQSAVRAMRSRTDIPQLSERAGDVHMATVVLDPGHGGKTKVGGSSPNNAEGPGGTLEKTVTLKVARAAREALEKPGVTVLMTRDSDVNRGLAERAGVAKQANAEVFVSIHFNGYDHKAQGTETWVSPNASKASRTLATMVQSSVRAVTGLKDRGVKDEKSLAVLRPGSHSAATAAVLVEISFMDIEAEEKRLGDKAYIDALGDAICSACLAYLTSIGKFNEALEVAEEELEDGHAVIMLAGAGASEGVEGVPQLALEMPDVAAAGQRAELQLVHDDLRALAERVDRLLGSPGAPAVQEAAQFEVLDSEEALEGMGSYSFQSQGLTKMKFLDRNRSELDRLIGDVNGTLAVHYGSKARSVSFLDAAVMLNCEAGLKGGGLVDPDHQHSEGERGLLPLPSNLSFWNRFAGPTPNPNSPMPLATNIWQFMLYLGQLKNKAAATTTTRVLYRDLFAVPSISGDPKREARLLAGIVHGYFTRGTYTSGGVPFTHILDGYANDVALPDLMRPTKYRHAGKPLMVGRHGNIEEALARFKP